MRGWAFGIMNRSVNFDEAKPRRRVDETVLMYDDECKLRRGHPHFGLSSTMKEGDLYVVWVTEREDGEGFSIQYQSQGAIFGGIARATTLEEAQAIFDRIRGQDTHQASLF